MVECRLHSCNDHYFGWTIGNGDVDDGVVVVVVFVVVVVDADGGGG